MRILKLRFANLNSLAGEWAIDFTQTPYTEEGLFAITGPTGVGKTTIMDAICLALYGQTPRLGRITKNANEIMTRHRAECFSEVVFETSSGRWRAHWSQHRSRKKADGELQAPRQEIVDDKNGRVLESSIQKTQIKIENITGLDFAQFTRAMMLAQGAFAAFLNADTGERASLLEKITGVAIYGEISKMVHERRREESDRLNAVEAELKSLPAGENSGEELRQQKSNLQNEALALEKLLAQYNTAAGWRETLIALEKTKADLAAKETALTASRRNFEPQAVKLQQARRALPLEAPHRQWRTAWQRKEEAARKLGVLKTQIPEIEKISAEAASATLAAEEKLRLAKTEEAAARPLIRQVRDLELQLAENEKQLKEQLGNYQRQMAAVEKQRANLSARTEDGLKDIENELENENKFLTDLNTEIETLRLERERNLAIKNLAEYRPHLVPGQPCGLCGSVHHPYADSALIPKEKINDEVWREKSAVRDQRQKNVLKLTGNVAALRQFLESEAGAAAERLKSAEEQLAAAEKTITNRRNDQNNMRQTRGELFGPRETGAEEKRLEKAMTEADNVYQASRGKQVEAEKELLRYKTRIEELTHNLTTLDKDEAGFLAAFTSALEQTGFADETAYRNAALPKDELAELEEEQRRLDESWAALLLRQKENSGNLENERQKNVTELPLATLQNLTNETKVKHSEIQRNIGALEQRLEEWRRNGERRRQLEKQRGAQKKECETWIRLHDLIGSHDGQKFRNYAQGLTFEAMTSQANRQLAGLSDRYRLIRDPGQPLELLVADDYQAGAKRSTRNLSGGESFLVSLALALGLSKMASRRVRVDSLFLDEGFGTLDEETLDLALDALARLQRDGKLIGVISHMAALKNRITTQIKVSSKGGPLSTISGPGVSLEKADIQVKK